MTVEWLLNGGSKMEEKGSFGSDGISMNLCMAHYPLILCSLSRFWMSRNNKILCEVDGNLFGYLCRECQPAQLLSWHQDRIALRSLTSGTDLLSVRPNGGALSTRAGRQSRQIPHWSSVRLPAQTQLSGSAESPAVKWSESGRRMDIRRSRLSQWSGLWDCGKMMIPLLNTYPQLWWRWLRFVWSEILGNRMNGIVLDRIWWRRRRYIWSGAGFRRSGNAERKSICEIVKAEQNEMQGNWELASW
jgi:hypothetical protein